MKILVKDEIANSRQQTLCIQTRLHLYKNAEYILTHLSMLQILQRKFSNSLLDNYRNRATNRRCL